MIWIPAPSAIQAYAKASRVLGMISRTISYKTPTVLLKLCKTLVRPHLEYCIPVWSLFTRETKPCLSEFSIDSLGCYQDWSRSLILNAWNTWGNGSGGKKKSCRPTWSISTLPGLICYIIWPFLCNQFINQHEVIQQRSRRPDATLMWDAFSSRRGSSTDGIGCNSKISTFRLWTPSKQFLNGNVNGRWASLWTDRPPSPLASYVLKSICRTGAFGTPVTIGTVMLVTLVLHTRHRPWWVLVHLVHFVTCDVWYTGWHTTPISTPSSFFGTFLAH